jgi:putative membrane protein
MKNKPALILLVIYLILFIICAINPYARDVWWAENLPIMIIVAVVIVVSRFHKFTPTSYILMSVLVYLHTIGGHFTFERVPFDFVNNLFGFERNNYDRFAHFSVGFYAYPIAELLLSRKLVSSKVILALFPIFSIFAVAGGYEIIEWLFAVSAEQSAGTAVLGSQGDIWDAQKDMLMDIFGSIIVMILFFQMNKIKIKDLSQ